MSRFVGSYLAKKLLNAGAEVYGIIKRRADSHNRPQTISSGGKNQKMNKGDLLVIVGSEIMTEKGEVIGLFLNEEIPTRSFLEVVDSIKSQEGIVAVPHPFDRMRKSSFSAVEEHLNFIDCIEVLQFQMHFPEFQF
jgi:predicted metal-dependent phosphoesterase TrpH